MKRVSPVIIIGMHRSGTTLLSKILEQTGIFMGKKKDENNEAYFFIKFNEFSLRRAGGSWKNPNPFFKKGRKFLSSEIKRAKRYLRSFKRYEYTGWNRFFKYKSLEEIDFPWGWKDPRNSLLLDLWVSIFPNAKIIHIYRNPIDVAESLRKRSVKEFEYFNKNLYRKLKLKYIKLKKEDFGSSEKIFSIDEGIALWETYINKIYEFEKKLNLNIFHLKYEDFLENPDKYLYKILEYLSMKNKIDIENLVKNINKDRKYAFLKDKGLVEKYHSIKNKEILKRLGYDDII